MKTKKLKKLIDQTVGTLRFLKSVIKGDEIYFLNDFENEQTQGGQAGDDCPKLNKKACNPYGVCSINIEIKRRRKRIGKV